MADNFISYQRFTSLPPNISSFGATVEEFKMQKGAPDANPVVSPMANTEVTQVRLALARTGSDKVRLGEPSEPEANPYEGARPNLVLCRGAVHKMQSAVVAQLHRLVNDDRAQASMSRFDALREFMANQVRLGEEIDARRLSAAKG